MLYCISLIAFTNDRYRKMKNSAHVDFYSHNVRSSYNYCTLGCSFTARWSIFHTKLKITQGLGMLVHFAEGTFLVTVPEQERAQSES